MDVLLVCDIARVCAGRISNCSRTSSQKSCATDAHSYPTPAATSVQNKQHNAHKARKELQPHWTERGEASFCTVAYLPCTEAPTSGLNTSMSEEYTFRTGVRARHGAVITQGISWHMLPAGTWFPCSMHRQIGGWTIYIKQKPMLASHRGNSQGQHHLQYQDDLVPALYQHSWRGYGEICDAPVSDLTMQGTSSAACVGAHTVSLHQSDYAPRSAMIANTRL